jgi:hypothetical protein
MEESILKWMEIYPCMWCLLHTWMGLHSLNLNNLCLSLALAKNGDQHLYEYKSYPANEVRDTKNTQNFRLGGRRGHGFTLDGAKN